ncbi:MAG: GlsB/YeaQ/YmgE family stress response membrane protein [Anaerolineae bacterium]
MSIILLILLLIAVLFVLSLITKIAFALFLPVLLWAFSGWLAGKLVNGRGSGLIQDVLLGLAGGFVGGFLFGGGGLLAQFIFGTIGAVLVVVVINFLQGRRRPA